MGCITLMVKTLIFHTIWAIKLVIFWLVNIVNFIKSYHKFVIRVAYKSKLDGKFIKYPEYKKVMRELLDIYLNPGKYIYGLEK